MQRHANRFLRREGSERRRAAKWRRKVYLRCKVDLRRDKSEHESMGGKERDGESERRRRRCWRILSGHIEWNGDSLTRFLD